MKKKLLVTMLAVSMLTVSLTACGGGKTEEKDTKDKTEATEEDTSLVKIIYIIFIIIDQAIHDRMIDLSHPQQEIVWKFHILLKACPTLPS